MNEGNTQVLLPQPDGGAMKIIRIIGITIVLSAACGKLYFRGVSRGIAESRDFAVYYCSTKAWLAGENPYDANQLYKIARDSGGVPDCYLSSAFAIPTTFVALAPFAMLPWTAAKITWLIVNLILILAMFLCLMKLSGIARARDKIFPWILLAFILAFAPLNTGLGSGQTANACVAFIVAAMYLQSISRAKSAGILLALAFVLKPQIAAIFIVYWIYRRRIAGVAAGVISMIVLSAIALAVLSSSGTDWFTHLQANISNTMNGGFNDYTIASHRITLLNMQGLGYAIFGNKTAAEIIAWGFCIAVIMAAFIAIRGKKISARNELLAGGLLGAVWLLPVYHRFYDAAVLVIPLCWAFASLRSPLKRYAAVVIFLTIPFLVSGAAGASILLEEGRIPASVGESWWWNCLVIPHQIYLIMAITLTLLAALFKLSNEHTRENIVINHHQ